MTRSGNQGNIWIPTMKKKGSVGILSSGEETESFDEAINSLNGNSGCEITPGP